MKPIVINKDGEMIKPTDWQKKSQEIIRRLDEELFNNIDYSDCYSYRYDKDGNEIGRTKRTLKKGEILPTISPNQVATKLNRLMRIYRPMTIAEAKSLEDTEYLQAYGYYLDIISHIEKYTTFLADKQTFSAFINITDDVYNELMQDAEYERVFKSIDNGFVQENFVVAQAGLVDSKTTITKLTVKDAGHSLIKSPDSIVYNVSNKVDQQQILLALDKFDSITKKLPKGDK